MHVLTCVLSRAYLKHCLRCWWTVHMFKRKAQTRECYCMPPTKEPRLLAHYRYFLPSLLFIPSLSCYIRIHFFLFLSSVAAFMPAFCSCCRSQTITAIINHIDTSCCAIQSQACIWMKTHQYCKIALCVETRRIFIQGCDVYELLSSILYSQAISGR